MRIYIIGNDGITLCREPPAAVNDGEIAVASNEELHAAPLSGKRLLALWNALPDIEKRSWEKFALPLRAPPRSVPGRCRSRPRSYSASIDCRSISLSTAGLQ